MSLDLEPGCGFPLDQREDEVILNFDVDTPLIEIPPGENDVHTLRGYRWVQCKFGSLPEDVRTAVYSALTTQNFVLLLPPLIQYTVKRLKRGRERSEL